MFKTVAVVREACVQVLGIVVKFMKTTSVLKVLDILVILQNRAEWEVGPSKLASIKLILAETWCLFGMKYVVAVRLDLVQVFISKILPQISKG